jgi:hypothetical protein
MRQGLLAQNNCREGCGLLGVERLLHHDEIHGRKHVLRQRSARGDESAQEQFTRGQRNALALLR